MDIYNSLVSQMSEAWKPFLMEKNVESNLRFVCKKLQTYIDTGVKFGPDIDSLFKIFSITDPIAVRVVILVEKNGYIWDQHERRYTNSGIVYSTVPGTKMTVPVTHLHAHVLREYPTARIPDHGDLTQFCASGIFMMPIYWTVKKRGDKYEIDMMWKMFSVMVLNYIYKMTKTTTQPPIVFIGAEPRNLWQEGELRACNYPMVFAPSMYSAEFIESSMIRDIKRAMSAAGQQHINWEDIFTS